MKKWIIGGLILCLVAFIVAKNWMIIEWLIIPPSKGEQFETWQTQNEAFQIRVQAFHEAHGGFVPGAYYVFSSAPVGSSDWKEIMTFRHDDPIQIRKNQVQFVTDDVGFVFMGWMFASTNDAGKHWQTWDGCDRAAALKICNYEGIKTVDLTSTGSGTITVSPKEEPLPVLYTEDFGRTWHE